MSGSRAQPRDLVAQLGEHGASLLREELGLSEEAVADLRTAGQVI